jgi:hypothetical protein
MHTQNTIPSHLQEMMYKEYSPHINGLQSFLLLIKVEGCCKYLQQASLQKNVSKNEKERKREEMGEMGEI